jgi:hypothetical protein
MPCNEGFFKEQGNMNIKGSKDAIREAFNKEFIEDGEGLDGDNYKSE